MVGNAENVSGRDTSFNQGMQECAVASGQSTAARCDLVGAGARYSVVAPVSSTVANLRAELLSRASEGDTRVGVYNDTTQIEVAACVIPNGQARCTPVSGGGTLNAGDRYVLRINAPNSNATANELAFGYTLTQATGS